MVISPLPHEQDLVALPNPQPLKGTLSVPGDKSLGHRAWMATLLRPGTYTLYNVPNNADVTATRECMTALGLDVTPVNETDWQVTSPTALGTPAHPLDCKNAGTAMRLLAGLLSGLNIPATLVGDVSLSSRPMDRILTPLQRMGANITGQAHPSKPNVTVAPLQIHPQIAPLTGISYTLPMPSAQVKSAILMAGLFAQGTTTVMEPIPSRDHTERLFQSLGLPLTTEGSTITVQGGWQRPALEAPLALTVPGDPSSAAFILGAAALIPGSIITLENVLLNPTRLGWVKVFRQWGVPIKIQETGTSMGETLGSLSLSWDKESSTDRLKGDVTLTDSDIPALIDELPLLAIVAQRVQGTFTVGGAEELRHKESDRIALLQSALRAVGGNMTPLADGFIIEGDPQRMFFAPTAAISTGHDHRIALSMRVLNTAADPNIYWPLDNTECMAVSFPKFDTVLAQLQQP
ncbi:MAG: 3-phosphoshikimate 1-carboxyvinyltransferase [Vampirovibrionales bacterium]|nr:3-phosphoshikimate 1-carboxyvinyltransferase [Vampirovibrionales bacterium]